MGIQETDSTKSKYFGSFFISEINVAALILGYR